MTVLQQKDFTAAGPSTVWATGNFASPITAGSAIVVIVGGSRPNIPSSLVLTDTLGNTYTEATGALIDDTVANSWWQKVYYTLNSAGGTNSITMTSNDGISFPMIVGVELSSILTSAALDGASGQRQATPGTGTDAVSSGSASNTATVTQVGFSINFNGGAQPTAGSGFTGLAAILASSARVESRQRTSTGSTAATFTVGSGQGSVPHYTQQIMLKESAGGAATLSSATPSGTVGNPTSATIGATTNQASGTGYTVLSTTNNVSTATAAQIKLGQNSTGASAAFAFNASIGSTTISIPATGLTATTLYYFATVQNNGNGDSNVVSGSFTTASPVPTITSVDGDNVVTPGQTSVVIIGTNFGASQGSGSVKISPTNNVADGGAVSQTVTAWSDTSITITVVKGSLSLDTTVYAFVTNNPGNANATGKSMQIAARAYIRETLINLSGAAVASLASVTMLVWRSLPTTGAPNPSEALTVSTNGSGQVDQQITRGSLAISDPVWVAFLKDGSPARGTLRKVTPVYE